MPMYSHLHFVIGVMLIWFFVLYCHYVFVELLIVNNMNSYEKICVGIILFAFIVGAGCSVGWLAYHHEWFALGCNIVVIAFGIPTFKKLAMWLLDK